MVLKQNVAPARLAWICWQTLWLSLLWHWPTIQKARSSKLNVIHLPYNKYESPSRKFVYQVCHACSHPVLTKMLSIRKLHIQLDNGTRHRRNLSHGFYPSSLPPANVFNAFSFACIHIATHPPTHPKNSSISPNVKVLKLWAGNKCHGSSNYVFYVGS